ncbi:IS600 ORF1 [Shigella dysenteriae]|uniref:IS600 ORF1 n=1 Tax=Shigella dysenteriae TaxID=622 RepID=A0A2X2IBU1_SHIDY|nr:IS600 ORF1 [Shigella dysenteriae]
MSRKTQRYSKEFKAEAVRTVLENQLRSVKALPDYPFLKHFRTMVYRRQKRARYSWFPHGG